MPPKKVGKTDIHSLALNEIKYLVIRVTRTNSRQWRESSFENILLNNDYSLTRLLSIPACMSRIAI